MFDSAGNVVGLVGIALAARPADDSHPYGHAKFETYASLVIGVLLLLAAFEVGSSAVGKLVSGVYTAEVTPVSFIVMVGTIAVNIGVTTYERRCAKRLKSEVLAADANHTLSDALVSIGVIVGLAAVALGFPMADPIMALVVTVAILATAYDVFKHALATLSDHARIPDKDVRAVAMGVPGVQDAHHIRTRGTGRGVRRPARARGARDDRGGGPRAVRAGGARHHAAVPERDRGARPHRAERRP